MPVDERFNLLSIELSAVWVVFRLKSFLLDTKGILMVEKQNSATKQITNPSEQHLRGKTFKHDKVGRKYPRENLLRSEFHSFERQHFSVKGKNMQFLFFLKHSIYNKRLFLLFLSFALPSWLHKIKLQRAFKDFAYRSIYLTKHKF